MKIRIHTGFAVLGILLFGVIFEVGAKNTTRESSPNRGRTAAPADIACDRNDLTSLSGEVREYSRDEGELKFVISTDWDTNEPLVLSMLDSSVPSPSFRINGQAFSKDDWQLIENNVGEVNAGMRVNVWVCNDGKTPPLVDWQPGKPGEPDERVR